jgi:hypothetical protein
MDLFVGQTSLKGDFRRYARDFNYVELLAEPQQLPNVKKVASLASETLGKVQFGVVLSPRVWEGAAEDSIGYFKKVVKACKPTWAIVRTPSNFRPGAASERELSKRLDDLRPMIGEARLAWEARGLWEPAMVARVAEALQVTPVWDGLSLPGASFGEAPSYVRFSELGVGSRVNEGRLERLAVKAEQCSTLYVVVEGRGAQRTRQILQGLFDDPFAGLDDAGVAGLAAAGGVELLGSEGDDGSEGQDDLDDDDLDDDELGHDADLDDAEDDE